MSSADSRLNVSEPKNISASGFISIAELQHTLVQFGSEHMPNRVFGMQTLHDEQDQVPVVVAAALSVRVCMTVDVGASGRAA